MLLAEFVRVLELRYPRLLAASWDNVGLLVAPPGVNVRRVVVTNDLSRRVLEEAKEKRCDMILCYHPVIFRGIKCLDSTGYWKDALCLDAYLNGISIYSPHTILDTADGGVADWLGDAFSAFRVCGVRPITPFNQFPSTYATLCTISDSSSLKALVEDAGKFFVFRTKIGRYLLSAYGPDDAIWTKLAQKSYPPLTTIERMHITSQGASTLMSKFCFGEGRIVTLERGVSLNSCVEALKKHIGVDLVQVATPPNATPETHMVDSIALCPGSGSSVLRGVKVKLVVTGEMDHHSILDFIEGGTAVVLTHHSKSERGFLPCYVSKISSHLHDCGIPQRDMPDFMVSISDYDPLVYR